MQFAYIMKSPVMYVKQYKMRLWYKWCSIVNISTSPSSQSIVLKIRVCYIIFACAKPELKSMAANYCTFLSQYRQVATLTGLCVNLAACWRFPSQGYLSLWVLIATIPRLSSTSCQFRSLHFAVRHESDSGWWYCHWLYYSQCLIIHIQTPDQGEDFQECTWSSVVLTW